MSLLKNKIAVVTGGSSGIGLATAKRFVEEGAYVFIAGRRQAELDKAVAEIGKNVTAVKTDISKLDDLDRLYETVAKKGKIDVIFAGAAFVEKTMTAAATPEHFDKTFNTNARGTYFTVQKALPYLNDGASIILVASAGKNKGFPGRSTYSATKAALRSFARTWTSEFKDRKIRTNVLSPGPVDTPMFDGQFPSKEGAAEARKQITAMIPLGRPGTSRRDRGRSFVPRLGPKQLRRRYRPSGRRRPDGCLDRKGLGRYATHEVWPHWHVRLPPVPRHGDFRKANRRGGITPHPRRRGRRGDQLSRYRRFLSHGRRARAARRHGRDHRTLAQRQARPLYRRVKSRGADEPATLGPGRLAQASARCDRRLAAPSRHRLRRSISASLGRSHNAASSRRFVPAKEQADD